MNLSHVRIGNSVELFAGVELKVLCLEAVISLHHLAQYLQTNPKGRGTKEDEVRQIMTSWGLSICVFASNKHVLYGCHAPTKTSHPTKGPQTTFCSYLWGGWF